MEITQINGYKPWWTNSGHDKTQANNNVEAAAYLSFVNRSHYRLTDVLFYLMIQNYVLHGLPTKLGFQKVFQY